MYTTRFIIDSAYHVHDLIMIYIRLDNIRSLKDKCVCWCFLTLTVLITPYVFLTCKIC